MQRMGDLSITLTTSLLLLRCLARRGLLRLLIRGPVFFLRGLVFLKVVLVQVPTTNFVSIHILSRIFRHSLFSCLTLQIPRSYSSTEPFYGQHFNPQAVFGQCE